MNLILMFTLLLLLACFERNAVIASGGVVGGKRTLVLVEDDRYKVSHSAFYQSLEASGHILSLFNIEENLPLKYYGQYKYDNIILLAPTAEDYGQLTVSDLLDFIDAGHNLLIAATEEVSETYRELAAAIGIDLDQSGSVLIDHINFATTNGSSQDHTKVLTSNYIEGKSVLFEDVFVKKEKPVVFQGIGMAVGDDNILALKLLCGASTSYSSRIYKQVGEYPENAGSDSVLVAGIQARNNARITFVGSAFMLSNEAFSMTGVANDEFATAISEWTFCSRGVLRARDINHMKADGTSPDTQLHRGESANLPTSMYPDPEIAPNSLVYRIKENVTYQVVIEEYRNGGWRPYVADDVQLEFVMLDPYIRTNLKTDGSGLFQKTFTTPDVYGVFKFRIQYRRLGYSTLSLTTQVSVRPFSHNEYERFIPTAFPYYSSALSMVVGFFLFSFGLLYHRDRK